MSTAAIPSYSNDFAQSWNRFWFSPSDPLPLCVLRIGVGLCALLYLGVYTPDLNIWLSSNGMIPLDLYDRVAIADSQVNVFAYWSYFAFLGSPTQILAAHVVGLVVVLLFTLGCFSRVTSILSLFVFLQYAHRATFVTAQVEPVLAMLLLYLCIGPSGAMLSIDAWRRGKFFVAEPATDWTATLSLRLIQIHLAALYFTMGTSKLFGEIWWRGEGIWSLMALMHTRWIDWSFLREYGYVINAWTHLQVFYELSFAALIWPRFTRPIMLVLGIVLWLLLLPVSGLVNFCLLMIVANMAYVPAAWLRSWLKLGPLPTVATY